MHDLIHRHAYLASTSDEAHRLAEAGAPHGTVVHALQQSSGRGRLGRAWSSPAGNLYVSVVLRPPIECRPVELGFVVALAVLDAVDQALPPHHRASLKWPNDIMLDGAKLAGILMEVSGGSMVAGIGINIASAPSNLPYPATALNRYTAATVEQTLLGVLAGLDRQWTLWLENGFAVVRKAWLLRGPSIGQAISVTQGALQLKGCFSGLAEDGALLLDTPEGQRRILTGDISG